MQLYAVKLNDKGIKDLNIREGLINKGFLASPDTGLIMLYTRGVALKKAIMFDGKIQKYGKNYNTDEYITVRVKIEDICPETASFFLLNEPINVYTFQTQIEYIFENQKVSPEVGDELQVLSQMSYSYDAIIFI